LALVRTPACTTNVSGGVTKPSTESGRDHVRRDVLVADAVKGGSQRIDTGLHRFHQPREVYPPAMGEIVALPEVGSLHHRYQRLAA
jgi:hypothetical protein